MLNWCAEIVSGEIYAKYLNQSCIICAGIYILMLSEFEYDISPLHNTTSVIPWTRTIKEFWPLALHNNIKVSKSPSAGEQQRGEDKDLELWN